MGVEHCNVFYQRPEYEAEGNQQEVVDCVHVADFGHVGADLRLQQDCRQDGRDAEADARRHRAPPDEEAAPGQHHEHHGWDVDGRHVAFRAASERKRCFQAGERT